jgi:hypothetical protein
MNALLLSPYGFAANKPRVLLVRIASLAWSFVAWLWWSWILSSALFCTKAVNYEMSHNGTISMVEMTNQCQQKREKRERFFHSKNMLKMCGGAEQSRATPASLTLSCSRTTAVQFTVVLCSTSK